MMTSRSWLLAKAIVVRLSVIFAAAVWIVTIVLAVKERVGPSERIGSNPTTLDFILEGG